VERPEKNGIVVIVSADAEWRAIRRLIPAANSRTSPMGEWFITTIDGDTTPLLFFHGGWGKIAAAATTQYVVDHCSPSLIINLGTCGGFEGRVSRGTIVLVKRTIVYDIFEQMGDNDEHLAHYSTELDLSWLPDTDPPGVVRSLMISADRDLVTQDLPELNRKFGAIVGDWESASIAWVAKKNRVRTLILRGVSDLVGESGGEAYTGNSELFESRTQEIMASLLSQLRRWI
jgi:adenosylhomocysteine nucleosidase